MRSKYGLFRILTSGVLMVTLAGCSTVSRGVGEDIAALRLQVQSLERRLRELENRQEQVSAAVAKARGAVAFVWGSYTFIDSTGRPLRHVLNEDGEPIADANGVPLVDVAGTGSMAVTNYSGTAFLVDKKAHLLTNRHVVEPWQGDESSTPLLAAGLRPVFIHLRVFFQERADGVPIEVLRVDADQDVALVRTVGWIPTAEPLMIHPQPGSVREGQPVFLVGYPSGLDAVLARLDTGIEAELEKATGGDSYAKAQLLAQRQQLLPSMTGGFLWEILPHTLVYDAQGAGGSSGGPLLDRQGRVIGINAAYFSGFRRINYGVPIKFGQQLLAGGGQQIEGPTREAPDSLEQLKHYRDSFDDSFGSALSWPPDLFGKMNLSCFRPRESCTEPLQIFSDRN